MKEPVRCAWAGSDPLYRAYHDKEWGVPSRDERHLFEMLNLEGAQAGLSWITILKKRENYRRAFDEFDPERIARYDDAKVAALLAAAGIVPPDEALSTWLTWWVGDTFGAMIATPMIRSSSVSAASSSGLSSSTG